MNDLIEASKKILLGEGKIGKITARDIKKEFNNVSDWGPDFKNRVRVVGKNLEVVDSFWAGSEKAMENLKRDWIDDRGAYSKYFLDEFKIKFTLVDEFVQVKAEPRYKKFTKDGVVGIVLKITNL